MIISKCYGYRDIRNSEYSLLLRLKRKDDNIGKPTRISSVPCAYSKEREGKKRKEKKRKKMRTTGRCRGGVVGELADERLERVSSAARN